MHKIKQNGKGNLLYRNMTKFMNYRPVEIWEPQVKSPWELVGIIIAETCQSSRFEPPSNPHSASISLTFLFLPQGLCISHSVCLGHSSPSLPHRGLLVNQLKYHLLNEAPSPECQAMVRLTPQSLT